MIYIYTWDIPIFPINILSMKFLKSIKNQSYNPTCVKFHVLEVNRSIFQKVLAKTTF